MYILLKLHVFLQEEARVGCFLAAAELVNHFYVPQDLGSEQPFKLNRTRICVIASHLANRHCSELVKVRT